MSEEPKGGSGREREEDKAPRPAGSAPDVGDQEPLFLSGKSDGRKGDAQDEKDGAAE